MENASKALMMAGGVLLVLLTVAVAVMLHNRYKESAQSIEKTQSAQEISTFNNEFEKYVGRQDITVQEIMTLSNLISEYSKKGIIVEGYINNSLLINEITIEDLSANLSSKKTYKFEEIKYDDYGRVNYIKFK